MGQTVTGFCSYCLQLPLLLKAKKGTNPATRCSLSPDIFTKRSQVPSRCCCCCGTKAEVWALATLCGLRLFHSRWTEVNSTVRSAVTGLRAACSLCQSPASTLTGPQTPVDSTPTFSSIAQATSCQGNLKNRCVCLSDETNSVLLFFLLAHQFILHSCVYSWILTSGCFSLWAKTMLKSWAWNASLLSDRITDDETTWNCCLFICSRLSVLKRKLILKADEFDSSVWFFFFFFYKSTFSFCVDFFLFPVNKNMFYHLFGMNAFWSHCWKQ